MTSKYKLVLSGVVAGVLAFSVTSTSASAAISMGTWIFQLEGGDAKLNLFTNDPTLGSVNAIDSISGTFTETGGSPEAVTLLPVGEPPYNPSQGNLATDNLWLNADTPSLHPHLDLHGFAFFYGSDPSNPLDKYEVFVQSGEYKGCWGTGDCITIPTPYAVPEPAAWLLMLTGFGAVGAVLRRRPALGPA